MDTVTINTSILTNTAIRTITLISVQFFQQIDSMCHAVRLFFPWAKGLLLREHDFQG